jgi:hypothetical protein
LVKVDTNESQWYAGAVFLMLTEEDVGHWPNEHAQLQKYGLAEGLQNLAKEIKKTSGKEVTEMLKLRKAYFDLIERCLESIEKTTHKMSLKGRCEYL